MSVEHKHQYRFVYLKSEQWESVRIQALVRDESKCRLCGIQNYSNDAHHIWYPKSFWKTEKENLIILCRDCHTLVHNLIPKIPNKKDEGESLWNSIVDCISVWRNALSLRIPEPKIPEPALDLEEVKKPKPKPPKRRNPDSCRACESPIGPFRNVDILQRYPNCGLSVTWKLCDSCSTNFIKDVVWPILFKQGKVFTALRVWIKSL